MKSRLVLAFYIRLSKEDMYKQNSDESLSVRHQRDLLQLTYRNHEELAGYEVKEFVDDGYSGTNFDRPSFQKMMEEVKRGKIQCIMVKDFSRFARNFLDAGDYLERIFPFLGIRFISVNDNYDSDKHQGTVGEWDIAFKNFIYDLYSKDISKKVWSAQKTKAKNGEYMGRPPLGYVRSKEIKNKLVIEPEGAKIVRYIFDLALEDWRYSDIVKKLNEENIPTPGMLYKKRNPDTKLYKGKESSLNCWDYGMVMRIVRNRTYTGANVNFKSGHVTPCSQQRRLNPNDEWIIVPDCHESIVTEEEFEITSSKIKEPRTRKGKKYIYPNRHMLSGYVVCGYCKRNMRYEYRATMPEFFSCITTKHADLEKSEDTCDRSRFAVKDIERVLLHTIQMMAEQADKRHCRITTKRQQCREKMTLLEARICKLKQQANKRKMEKRDIYELYVMGEMDAEEYLKKKSSIEKLVFEIEEQIKSANIELEAVRAPDSEAVEVLKNAALFSREEKLTEEMLKYFVKEIRVYRDNRYEIEWKFKDVLNDIR